MKSYSMTTKGNYRKNNEDFLFKLDKKVQMLNNLYIVCDGVGGNNYGEVASKLTVKKFIEGLKYAKDYYPFADESNIKNIFQKALDYVSKAFLDEINKNNKYKGMCTTIVCATVFNNKLYAMNVGDSRLYFITSKFEENESNDVEKKTISQLTQDDAEFIEQTIMPKDIANDIKNNNPNINLNNLNPTTFKRKVLTKAVGHTKNVLGNYYEIDLENKINNNFSLKAILCSDGLYDGLKENDILNIATNKNIKENKKCKELIKESINKGSKDNISVVLIDIN